MPATDLQITVAGRWISMDTSLGDVEMSTVWPGGSDQLSWTPGADVARRFRGGQPVVAYYGPVPVWSGSVLEPDPSQDQIVAQGAWREGDHFRALSAGTATAVPDSAIDTAIATGLQWTRPAVIQSTSTAIDITQGPVKLGELLDAVAENNGKRWGVDPWRQVYIKADDIAPTYQTLPLDGGLGYSLDSYASTLVARYIDSGTSAYATLPPITDTTAAANHGYVEDIVDLTSKGQITAARATTITTNLLSLGRAVPQWTASVEVTYGEILNMGGTPVALETVAAGEVLRIPGGFELAQRLSGSLYIDILIGQTSLAGGVLTLQPLSVASRTLTDTLALALSRSDSKRSG